MTASAVGVVEAGGPKGRGQSAKETNRVNCRGRNEVRDAMLREEPTQPKTRQLLQSFLSILNEVLRSAHCGIFRGSIGGTRPKDMERCGRGIEAAPLAEGRGIGRGIVNPLVKPKSTTENTLQDPSLEV